MARLSNPDTEASGLDRLVFKLFEGAGVAFMISGPYDLSEGVAAVRHTIPFFRDSSAMENGLAAHPAHGSVWAGLDGPMGSAVVLFIDPSDASVMASQVAPQLRHLDARWQHTVIFSGEIDDLAALHIRGATTIPAWEYLGSA